MAWSYDVSTAVGKLRLEIGDIDPALGVLPNGRSFQDEELDVYLTAEGGVLAAAVRLCEVLATHYARAVDTSQGELRQSLGQVAARYAAQAATLKTRAPGLSSASTGGMMLVPTRYIGQSPVPVAYLDPALTVSALPGGAVEYE